MKEIYEEFLKDLKPQLVGNTLIFRRRETNVLFPDIAITPGSEWLILGEQIIHPWRGIDDKRLF